jgi:hypothetical protein
MRYKFEDPDLLSVPSAEERTPSSNPSTSFAYLFLRKPPGRAPDQLRLLYKLLLLRSCADAEIDEKLALKRRPRKLAFYMIAKEISKSDEYMRIFGRLPVKFPLSVRLILKLLPRSWKSGKKRK